MHFRSLRSWSTAGLIVTATIAQPVRRRRPRQLATRSVSSL